MMAAVPALADKRDVSDRNDSRSALDMERVVQGHYAHYVLYKVVSHDSWDPIDLERGKMVFHFNTDGDPRIERRAILTYRGPRGAQMSLRTYNSHHEQVGGGVYRRPSGRSVEVWFKRRVLGYPDDYRFFVTVDTEGCGGGCRDRAPDRGTMSHDLQPLCGSSEATMIGTDGDDEFQGTKRSDVILSRGGDDEILGIGSGDFVCAGPGNDVVDGGRGWIFIWGGGGSDHLSASGPRPRPCDDTGGGSASCAYPEAVLIGGPGDDYLQGGRYHERLDGEEGNDQLIGKRAADALDGGPGHDSLIGGGGYDVCRHAEERSSCEN